MSEVIINDDYFCEKHLVEFLSGLNPVNFVKIERSNQPNNCSVCIKEIGRSFEPKIPGLSKITIS